MRSLPGPATTSLARMFPLCRGQTLSNDTVLNAHIKDVETVAAR